MTHASWSAGVWLSPEGLDLKGFNHASSVSWNMADISILYNTVGLRNVTG